MRKLLIVFAAGTLLSSCSSALDKEAAAGFCKCYNLSDAGESTNLSELMENAEKMTTCVNDWQKTFEGKITKEGFSDELKEQCPDAHTKADEMGMFK